MKPLAETIAVVTGSSRGAGRGIALALADAGATVYVTGRSVRGAGTTDDIAGTIDDTAEEVTRRGGRGIPVRCDHTSADDVQALFERVRDERGALDLLVNNAWGGYEKHDMQEFVLPFWEQPLRRWDSMFVAGVRAGFLASRFAAPLLIARGRGLIVNTTAWDADKYLGNLYYDVAKHAINRMAFGMSRELRSYNVAALALAPGFMRTERVLAVSGGNPDFDVTQTESPEYVGRAIVALAADPDVMRFSGQTVAAGDLAAEYGFTDVDGRSIPRFVIPEM
jgi:NAD(P)-dependent dehydrogenase (short-subunit alcohol dehydrogenase family)